MFFDQEDKRLLKELVEQGRKQFVLLEKILHRLQPQRLSQSAAVIFFSGETTMSNNALVFNVGQTAPIAVGTFLADGVTPSGATYSNAVFTFSDPSATIAADGTGTGTVTAVAASTGAVNGSVAFEATDTDGAVSQWTVPFTITTNAAVVPPPPSQLSQSAAVIFGTPTP